MCDHHPCLVPKHFHHPEENPAPVKQGRLPCGLSCFPLSPVPGSHQSNLCLRAFPCSGHFIYWSQTVFASGVWLTHRAPCLRRSSTPQPVSVPCSFLGTGRVAVHACAHGLSAVSTFWPCQQYCSLPSAQGRFGCREPPPQPSCWLPLSVASLGACPTSWLISGAGRCGPLLLCKGPCLASRRSRS